MTESDHRTSGTDRSSPSRRTGVWLVGARGNVATLAMTGARAVARGVAGTTGMVTERPPVTALDLPAVDGLVFGGHDVRSDPVVDRVEAQHERNGVPDRETLEAVRDDLAEVDERIETGTARNCGAAVADLADSSLENGAEGGDASLRDLVERIRGDYEAFASEHDLDRVVVANVASTEPALEAPDRYATRAAVEDALDADDPAMPASALYAYAALAGGHPYVNFTPSPGSALGGLRELAEDEGVPHAGRDAKTGETLVKSALAPMFAERNLRVRSWEGHNLLGNADGRVLEDERNEAGKLATKGGVLDAILPAVEHNRVRIDYAPSFGDWKTAWDHVHFAGFLDTEMTLQFTWEGSDSALAAPLLLDLVRLLAHADAAGERGLQPQLASFFKDPLGVDEHALTRQFDRLYAYVDAHRDAARTELARRDGGERDGG